MPTPQVLLVEEHLVGAVEAAEIGAQPIGVLLAIGGPVADEDAVHAAPAQV